MMSTISTKELLDCLPALRRFARSLTRNDEQADDLVQDCVERALRKAHLFDGTNLRSWLFTICRRLFLNNIRAIKTRGSTMPIEDAPQFVLAVKEPQEVNIQIGEVSRAIARLPKSDRVVISLIAVEGLKYEEAAATLNVPIGTIRSRLSRARARLQSLIDDVAAGAEGSRVAFA